MTKFTRDGAALVALASAFGVGVLPTGVAAQTVGDDFLEFGAEVDLRHDSNVVRGSREWAEETGFNGSDQIITPALTAAINKTLGRHAVRASVLVGYDFYMQNERLNNERINADVVGLANLSICEVRPSATYQRRQARTGRSRHHHRPRRQCRQRTDHPAIQAGCGVRARHRHSRDRGGEFCQRS